MSDDETPRCLDEHKGDCEGMIEYRMPLTETGRAFPRCDKHWGERLDQQERINERYPMLAPADFDPLYAGERWDDEY